MDVNTMFGVMLTAVLGIVVLCVKPLGSYIADVMQAGTGDLNNHQIGVADVLTGGRALQRSGTYCTGGARTLDLGNHHHQGLGRGGARSRSHYGR